MKKKIGFFSLSLTALLAASLGLAAGTFKTLKVKDLESLIQKKTAGLAIYDVNVESTRKAVGIIPGAKLLSSSSDYDVAKELPADKSSKLVFYCANTKCTASHSAAEKAMSAGYTDVSVMVDGIYGWQKAGKALEKPSVQPQAAPVKAEVQVQSPQSLAPADVMKLMNDQAALMVDVREGEERHQVIDQAQWMPMSKIEDAKAWAEFKGQLPKEKTIVFHCARGRRAKIVAEKLASEGFKTGFFAGPDQWQAAGLPLKAGN
jgi:rhodanese-related sulfurtransferase